MFQYLTIFNDFLAESDDFDEEKDLINHNFELLPQVLTIMASTLNEDVLAKTARYLFSVLELASETSDPMAKIGQLLSPQALGYLNEALKQSLDNRVSYLNCMYSFWSLMLNPFGFYIDNFLKYDVPFGYPF